MVRKFTESVGILEEYSKDLAQTSEDIELLSAPEKGLTVSWVDSELSACKKQLNSATGKQKQLTGEIKKHADYVLGEVEKVLEILVPDWLITSHVKDQAAAFVKLVSEIAEHLSSLTQKECSDQGARVLLKSYQKFVSDLKVLLSTVKEFAAKSKKDLQGGEEWVRRSPEILDDLMKLRTLLEWIFRQFEVLATGDQNIAQPPPIINNRVMLLISQLDGMTDENRNSYTAFHPMIPPQIAPSSASKTRLLALPERNHFATSVLKRVQSKLDGRDGGVVVSVQDQVSAVINSATSHSNLSLMYEGWTPWVRHENLLTMVRKFTESVGILEEYSKDLAQTSEDIELLSAPEKGLTVSWKYWSLIG
eukprot:sb/3465976/